MALTGISIRPARAADLPALAALHTAAFGGDAEARLVASLHAECDERVSLVAERDGDVAGHILFSPATLEPAAAVRLAGLAPMAVVPDLQRSGIGTALAEAGIAACRARGIDALVVLGHADYYPRFGFRPASRFGLACVYEVPDEAFMALELVPGCLAGIDGTVHYHPAFARL